MDFQSHQIWTSMVIVLSIRKVIQVCIYFFISMLPYNCCTFVCQDCFYHKEMFFFFYCYLLKKYRENIGWIAIDWFLRTVLETMPSVIYGGKIISCLNQLSKSQSIKHLVINNSFVKQIAINCHYPLLPHAWIHFQLVPNY